MVSKADGIDLAPGLTLPCTRMRFERNAEIFGEGEPADYVCQVVSGAVRTMRVSADGRRQILAFHFSGDVFGLEVAASHASSAEAVGPVELALVRRSLLERVANERPQAARAWVGLVAHALDEAQEHAMILARKGAGERLALFLLRLAARAPRGQSLELAMSRADIADYLGLTIESVSRAFTEMERQHAIALPSARQVVMRDRPALARAAA